MNTSYQHLSNRSARKAARYFRDRAAELEIQLADSRARGFILATHELTLAVDHFRNGADDLEALIASDRPRRVRWFGTAPKAQA